MTAELRSPPQKSHARECAWTVLEWLGILAIFALVAGWPVPDVNETHYLLKAKHHWQSFWAIRILSKFPWRA